MKNYLSKEGQKENNSSVSASVEQFDLTAFINQQQNASQLTQQLLSVNAGKPFDATTLTQLLLKHQNNQTQQSGFQPQLTTPNFTASIHVDDQSAESPAAFIATSKPNSNQNLAHQPLRNSSNIPSNVSSNLQSFQSPLTKQPQPGQIVRKEDSQSKEGLAQSVTIAASVPPHANAHRQS